MKEGIMNVIGKGTKVEGKIYVQGSIRVDGEVKGEVSTTDLFVLGKEGNMNGNLRTRNASISGRFEGNIHADGKVELLHQAVFKGELECKKLVIEEGVIFDGNISMAEERSGKTGREKGGRAKEG